MSRTDGWVRNDRPMDSDAGLSWVRAIMKFDDLRHSYRLTLDEYHIERTKSDRLQNELNQERDRNDVLMAEIEKAKPITDAWALIDKLMGWEFELQKSMLGWTASFVKRDGSDFYSSHAYYPAEAITQAAKRALESAA